MVETRQVNKLDGDILGRALPEFRHEPGTAVENQPGFGGLGRIPSAEQFPGLLQSAQVARSDGVVPFRFANGQEDFTTGPVAAEGGHINNHIYSPEKIVRLVGVENLVIVDTEARS